MPEAAAIEGTGEAFILIAEDNENDALFLRWAFEKAGLGKSILFVRDGEEVIKYLSRQPPFDDPLLCPKPSLLLLDGRMPKLDGLDVLLWLRHHPGVGPLRVVLCSSALTPEQKQKAVEWGASGCVNKPAPGEGWNMLVEEIREFGRVPPS